MNTPKTDAVAFQAVNSSTGEVVLLVHAHEMAKVEAQANRWRTVAEGLQKELYDMREFIIDREYSDEQSTGVLAADAALAAYEQAKKDLTTRICQSLQPRKQTQNERNSRHPIT